MTNTLVSNNLVSTNSISKKSTQKKQNKLGPYDLLQTLGEGEFGKVKLGVHMETGQEVAIKLIRKEGDESDNRINKVEREISVLKTLNHPYIVKLYNVVETEKYIGIILEYASGGELFEYILAHRFLKEKDAKRFFAQLISSVKYMHKRNIVHRDLKLENLLLDKNRNIIVTDFGFANQFTSAADDLMATTCGSPCYAAPELVVNGGLYAGSAVDVWSCGVILYAMLCGFLPFDDDPANPDSDNINQLYRYIMSTNLVFPSHITPEARNLLQKMLVPDPVKRCSLDHIIRHSWLKEYHEFFKHEGIRIEKAKSNETIKAVAPPDSKLEPASGLIVNSSISTTVPRKTATETGASKRTRKTHIPTVARDRFSPVANDQFLKSAAKDVTNDRPPIKSRPISGTGKHWLSSFTGNSQPSTAVSENTAHGVPSSKRNSKVPNFIIRKPVKKEGSPAAHKNNTDPKSSARKSYAPNEPPAIHPEKSLSSPISIHENKTFNLSTFGGIYKTQRRGTDKLFSFFTGTKVSQSLREEKDQFIEDHTQPVSEEFDQEEYTDNNDPMEDTLTDLVISESSIESEVPETIYNPIDPSQKLLSRSSFGSSTIGISTSSLCLSEDVISQASPVTPSSKQHTTKKPFEKISEKIVKMRRELSQPSSERADEVITRHSQIEGETAGLHARFSVHEDSASSIVSPSHHSRDTDTRTGIESIKSERGENSVRSSVISFKDILRYTPVSLHSQKEDSSLSSLRHSYNQNGQNESKITLKSAEEPHEIKNTNGPPQPEFSSSTRLTTKVVSSAVGDSGRKAIAAVRKSIYKKHRSQPNESPQNPGQLLDSVPFDETVLVGKKEPTTGSRFEENGKRVNNARERKQQPPSSAQRHTWGNAALNNSLSEATHKEKLKDSTPIHPIAPTPTAVPKKTNKMMDWIKKKSQGKEHKKESNTHAPQPGNTDKVSGIPVKSSTSKRISIYRNEKEPPATILINKTTKSTTAKTPKTEATNLNNVQPKAVIPERISNDSKIINQPNTPEESATSTHTSKINESTTLIPEQTSSTGREQSPSGTESILKESTDPDKSLIDEKIQVHQGAIDRRALTSQSPAVVLKDAARILRILGIETKFESEFVIKCHRRKAKSFMSAELSKKHEACEDSEEENSSEILFDDAISVNQQTEPVYGDSSFDNGDEIRFVVEICKIKNLPGLFIVDVRRLKGNAWAYKFLYHKLIDFLDLDKSDYVTACV